MSAAATSASSKKRAATDSPSRAPKRPKGTAIKFGNSGQQTVCQAMLGWVHDNLDNITEKDVKWLRKKLTEQEEHREDVEQQLEADEIAAATLSEFIRKLVASPEYKARLEAAEKAKATRKIFLDLERAQRELDALKAQIPEDMSDGELEEYMAEAAVAEDERLAAKAAKAAKAAAGQELVEEADQELAKEADQELVEEAGQEGDQNVICLCDEEDD
jgi:hypothetical protein